jgi:hypothetical protein
MDAVVRGALLGDDLSGGDDDTGWGLAALVRFWALKTLELDGGISYRDVIVSDTSLDVAALWYFVPNFALVGDASFGNDATYYGLGVRFTL